MKIYKVKNSSFDIEPHEVFLDKLAQRKEEDLGLSEKKFEVPLKEKISYVLFGIFFILSLINTILTGLLTYFLLVDYKGVFILVMFLIELFV